MIGRRVLNVVVIVMIRYVPFRIDIDYRQRPELASSFPSTHAIVEARAVALRHSTMLLEKG